MAKKKKRPMKAPGLSRLDRGIYYCLIACSCVTGLFLYPMIIGNFRQSVFRDTHILAQGNPGNVILIFFGMFIGGGFALFFDWMRRKRQPIFGKAGIQYGPPQWKSVYPLLSKQFLVHVSFTGMTQIKACFDLSIITLDGEGYLSSVVRDMDLNKQEAELLYLLFDVGQPPR